MTKDEILVAIDEMTAADMGELIEGIKERLGVKVTPPPSFGWSNIIAPIVEEQTEFDVHLISYGLRKINVIKVVRAELGLSLQESKAIVDTCPSVLRECISSGDADELKRKLEDVGATIEVR